MFRECSGCGDEFRVSPAAARRRSGTSYYRCRFCRLDAQRAYELRRKARMEMTIPSGAHSIANRLQVDVRFDLRVKEIDGLGSQLTNVYE